MAARAPLHLVSNSLAGVRRGRKFGIKGGSQMGGGNAAGEFGTLDLVSLGAPDNGIPPGVVYIKNGVTLGSYPAVHGPAPGFIEGARRDGLTAGLVVVERIVDATGAQDWVDTHDATYLADCVAAGIVPCVTFYATGGKDGASLTAVGHAETALHADHMVIKGAHDGSGFVVVGLMSTDLVAFPQAVALRATASRLFGDRLDNRSAYVDPTDYQPFLQSDITHLNSRGQVLLGLELWRRIRNNGIPL